MLNAVPKPVWKAWLPAMIWLGFIVLESTDTLSSANTSRFLYPLVKFFFGQVDLIRFFFWHMMLRKAGHVVGYAVLSFLLFRAWRATLLLPGVARWSFQWAGVSFLMSALVAGLDEFHQSFLPSRTGNLRDVLLDSAAALAAQVLIYTYLRTRRPVGGQAAAS